MSSLSNDHVSYSHAVSAVFEAKRAQRLSPNTLRDYERTLRKFREYLPDGDQTKIDQITVLDIREVHGFFTPRSKIAIECTCWSVSLLDLDD